MNAAALGCNKVRMLRFSSLLPFTTTILLLTACAGSEQPPPASGGAGGASSTNSTTSAGGATSSGTTSAGVGGSTTTSGTAGAGGSCGDTQSDPMNCGTCGHACAAPSGAVATCALGVCGKACSAGLSDCDGDPTNGCETQGACTTTVIATGLPNVSGIAVDDKNVYVTVWAAGPSGQLLQIPHVGGAPGALAAALAQPGSVASDGSYVYWANGEDGSGTGPSGMIEKVPIGGGVRTALALNQYFPIGVSVAADKVAWAEMGFVAAGVDGTVNSLPISGSVAATEITTSAVICGMKAVGSRAYYVECNAPAHVASVPLTGGAPFIHATATGSPIAVAAGGGSVVWAEYEGTIWSVPEVGGAPVLISSGETAPSDILVADGVVYWVNGGGSPFPGMVRKAPLGGGAPQTIATSMGAPAHLAVDGQYVYWTDGVLGTVTKALR